MNLVDDTSIFVLLDVVGKISGSIYQIDQWSKTIVDSCSSFDKSIGTFFDTSHMLLLTGTKKGLNRKKMNAELEKDEH